MKTHPIRIGIAGLDHFYIALGAINDIKSDPGAQLVILAHRDPDIARQVAEPLGARWTTDYGASLEEDIDLLITACPTSQNASLVIEAARRGKHILSVKPFAMNLDEGRQIVQAVIDAGVRFMSYEAGFRFNAMYRTIHSLAQQGKFGKLLSASCYFRTVLPDIAWLGAPALRTKTWWLDAAKTPAGAWLDHAVYFVDLLRWIFASEVNQVSGEAANLRHAIQPLEDFGTATLVFQDGQVATIEASWTTEMSGLTAGLCLMGAHGQIVQETITHGQMLNLQQEHRLQWMDYTDQVTGWQKADVSQASTGLTQHMLSILHGKEEPITNEQDALKTLAACLAFYQAAKEKRAVRISLET